MKKNYKSLIAFAITLFTTMFCTGTVAFAADADGVFQSLADWVNEWSTAATVLVPAIGTLVIVVIGVVVMTAGSQWSAKAKALMVSVIVGVAIVSYGPMLIKALLAKSNP